MSTTSLAISSGKRPSILGRFLTAVRDHPASAVAGVTLVLAWGGLLTAHQPTRAALPRAAALHAVLSDPLSGRMLSSVHWERVRVIPMDRHYEILAFYRGPRLVASVTVGKHAGTVILDVTNLSSDQFAYGSNIANSGWVLAALSVAFVLMTAVWPLRRLRNLDVLVLAALTLSVVVFNLENLALLVLITYPALIYLAIRCAWWGLGSRTGPPTTTPLYEYLTRRWPARQQLEVLRWMTYAMALIVAMVGLTSRRILDVAFAVMEGATQIVHGVLPYGHIPDVLHGDTYPIGSYLLYAPLARLWPVHDVWDSADVTLAIAVVAALLAAVAVRRVLARVSASSAAGLRAALAMLTFPPLLVTVSTGTTDVVLAAFLAAALALWQRPVGGSVALAAGAWFKLTPLALLPLWLARLRGAVLARALTTIVLLSAAMSAALVALGGIGAPLRMLHAISFQLSRSSPQNPWAVVGSVPLQQLVQAMTLALLAGACVKVRRDFVLAGDLPRIAAIAAAVSLGVQISAGYWSYMYLVWLLPLILVSLLGLDGTGASRSERTSQLLHSDRR